MNATRRRICALASALLLASCAVTGTAPPVSAYSNTGCENDLGRYAEAP